MWSCDVPHAAEHETGFRIGVAAPAIETGQRGILYLLRIVNTYHDLRLIRLVIDNFRKRIGGLKRDPLRKAFRELDEPSVIDGIAAAVENADAPESRVGARRPACS